MARDISIRSEVDGDAARIRSLTDGAFAGVEHSSGTEGLIVDALRAARALSISLVAERDGAIVGHVAFSPVAIDGEASEWYGLGPVSVSSAHQRAGIGSELIREGLRQLERRGARGCVVLGEPEYYGRFGFSDKHRLSFGDVVSKYFQSVRLKGDPPTGAVTYHGAFDTH